MSKDPNGSAHARVLKIAKITSPFAEAVHNIQKLPEALKGFTATFGNEVLSSVFDEAGINETGKKLKAIKRGNTALPREKLQALSTAAINYTRAHL